MYPPFDPVLLRIGNFSIHWYGLTMTLAIFLGTLVASRYVSRQGGDGGTVWDMLLWVLIPAVIGARLYYVFIQSPRSGPNGLPEYLANPIKIIQIWNGGIHIYGALIFGAIALLLYLRSHKLPYLQYLDGIGLGLALGQTIGRLGNFINQELYGPPTTLPWGLRIDKDHRLAPYNDMEKYPDSTRFQPLFLYEMLWDGIGFLALFWISRRFAHKLRQGDLFLLYLIWVPLGRFWIEFMRSDSWFFPGTPFNILHVIIALLVVGSLIVLIQRHRTPSASQLANAEATDTQIPSDQETSPSEEKTVHTPSQSTSSNHEAVSNDDMETHIPGIENA